MDRPVKAALCAVLFTATFVSSAMADTGTITGSDIAGFILPTIQAVVSALLLYSVGWLALLLKTKLGVSIDDSMRSSIQTAATNAAGLVLNQLGNSLQGKTITVQTPFIADAVNYVLKNAPDAVAHFGLTPDAIAQKIVALLPQIANTTTTANTPSA